jgi:NADPH:quinone reductase-like Zn-dependent oxidoreductase
LQIGDTPFDDAASLATTYASLSALFLYLGIERPPNYPASPPKREGKVLIWGVSSSFGASSAQLARQAGYTVVGVASGRHAHLAKTLDLQSFVDRKSTNVVQELVEQGPFKAVLAAADSAEDQFKIGQVLAEQGGGRFLSTMGVRSGVVLPDGVTGFFSQFLDDFLSPENKEFTQWVWGDFLETAFEHDSLKSMPLEVMGGLSQVTKAWKLLQEEKVSGKRLIIHPELD